ncbi:NAD(P)/FAD-dependent oxidoreductase [Alkaliphilus oremlandii]|uniref:FAD-dependent pyridine nucleotide-disulphide oxidoreductase n=1 Tax=Alkaliphilus oremlandii (strain OhILAs) TaxID=350688 RepID=A8MJP3_ALKOO|nr:FAD-dependent oxidoreductase [Alkaliphilus oremlandii]ABW20025.1 FAD-dependent pyridine nucleotide-disulphide oxidoreductase [Alkaliphilus oremlandii OhILAs]
MLEYILNPRKQFNRLLWYLALKLEEERKDIVGQVDYIIVGNGIAGLSAAETIRKKDGNGKILMISAEEYLTYYRVKLSHFISKDFTEKDFFVHDENWYKERNIDLILGKSVSKINTDLNELELSDGSKISYHKLLLANGSRPFVPLIKGNDKEGVFALRTIEDLNNLRKYFENVKSITVLGGGLLGLEAAWAIKKLNKEVNVVEFFPQLLPRQLDEGLSKRFGTTLEANGINLYLGTGTEEIAGGERVEAIKLQDGRTFNTDAVLISAGVRPILDLVKDTNIEFDKGIKVDASMRTNIENIYAAGDVAELNGMVVGLWGISADEGNVAGENMTGGNATYTIPELNTMLMLDKLSVFSIGNVKDFHSVIEDKDESKDAHYKLFLTDGKVSGAIVMNDMAKVPKVKKLVNNNVDLSRELAEGKGFSEII